MAARSESMPTSPLDMLIRHLGADLRLDGGGMTDGELLARFLGSRDGDALAALVRRHAPMVWGVCRRLLSQHDAEDAFQATFLVLVRKAAGVPRQAVANWIYGVARQTAVRLRALAAKRRRRETQVVNMPEPAVPELCDTDLQRVVDEELSRLPDHYRGVVVLCDLEGMTRREAARQLGIPEGSVASRLARARALLAKRLTLRGAVFSGGSVAVSVSAASASAPPALVSSTIKAASLLAAGQAAGVVSAKVAALTEGVVKAMFVTKIKDVLAVVLILGILATGATVLTCRSAAGQDDKKPAAEKPVEPAAKQEKEKETFTAWGREVGGLQAGLGFRPGERRAYHLGETVKLVLRIRNVGKEEATISFRKVWPSVIYGDGGTVTLEARGRLGLTPWEKMTLRPGKEIELQELKFELKPTSEGKSGFETFFGTGTFRITYEPSLDGGKDALNTGKLELEVKEPEKKQEKQEEKHSMTKEEKLRVLIEKVLTAHGGEDKLNKLQFTMTVKHSNGATQQIFVQPPNNFRSDTTLRTGERIVILFSSMRLNEGMRWFNEDGKEFFPLVTQPPMEHLLDSVRFAGPRQVLRLKDADHRVTLLDEEAKIDGRATVGVEVTGDGRAAVGVGVTGPVFKGKMYFDKETHLLLKSGSVTYSDYKKLDGIQVAQKMNDGSVMSQVTDFRAVDMFDAKLFE